MKKISIQILSVLLFVLLMTQSSFSGENKKLAQTGFQFLSVVSDAKASAMAEAMTSLQMGSSALFFNPAGMAGMEGLVDISASTNEWIADITHSTIAAAFSPAGGEYGVVGISLQSVSYGDFYGTVVDKSQDLGYRDTGLFEPTATSIGVGYAKRLTDRFSVGGQVRYVEQKLGETIVPEISANLDTAAVSKSNELTPLAFDFGTQFKTGFKSLVFGMSVRNFSKEIKYVEEGFQLPLVFNLGISMDVMDLLEEMPMDIEQRLIVSIDASHFRSHPEQVKVGLDYQLMHVLSLRTGYISNNDETGLSFGVGVSQFGIAFDYAYTPFGVFDKVQRMTARFSL